MFIGSKCAVGDAFYPKPLAFDGKKPAADTGMLRRRCARSVQVSRFCDPTCCYQVFLNSGN